MVVITVLGAGACSIGGSVVVGSSCTADGVGSGDGVGVGNGADDGVGSGVDGVGVGNGVDGEGVGNGVDGAGVGKGVAVGGSSGTGELVGDVVVVVCDGEDVVVVVSDDVVVGVVVEVSDDDVDVVVDVSDPGSTTAGSSGRVAGGAPGGTVALAFLVSTFTDNSCHWLASSCLRSTSFTVATVVVSVCSLSWAASH